jgi:hypothetical protein
MGALQLTGVHCLCIMNLDWFAGSIASALSAPSAFQNLPWPQRIAGGVQCDVRRAKIDPWSVPFGSSGPEGEAIERAIEEGCERIDPRDW